MQKKSPYKLVANLTVFLSVIFLILYLVRNNQIKLPEILNVPFLVLSVVLVLMGFIAESIGIRIFLRDIPVELNLRESIIITGRYILSKYIPGKVGVLVGKASYLSSFAGTSPLISFQRIFLFQILTVLSSFMVSVIPLYAFLGSGTDNLILFFLTIAVLFIIMLQKSTQEYFLKMAGRIIKKDLGNYIHYNVVLKTLFFLMLSFILWSAGFLFLALSTGLKLNPVAGFLFPVAALAGVVVLIAPGGIGVREGIIAAGLVFYGQSDQTAIGLSTISRIWFLSGELLIFVVAGILSLNKDDKPEVSIKQ